MRPAQLPTDFISWDSPAGARWKGKLDPCTEATGRWNNVSALHKKRQPKKLLFYPMYSTLRG